MAEVMRLATRAHEAIYRSEEIGALILNEGNGLVNVIGRAVDWLEFPPGPPPAEAARLVRDVPLRSAISSLLRQMDEGDPHPNETVSVDLGQGHSLIDLQASRLDDHTSSHTLVIGRPTRSSGGGVAPDEDATQVSHLRRELAVTRGQLEAAIQQQEISHVELTSTNEELLVSNEELQTSIEELSSVNEELRTVADENELRLRDVLELGADLEQVLDGTDIGILLLSGKGTIRRFSKTCPASSTSSNRISAGRSSTSVPVST